MELGKSQDATPTELAQANELAERWCRESDNPIVLWGATIIVLHTIIEQAVAPADREHAIEMVSSQLHDIVRLCQHEAEFAVRQ